MEDYVFKNIMEDKVDYHTPGFYFKSHGRGATIYFVENTSIVPIYAEMPGGDYLDILVFGETKHIDKRYYIKEQKVEVIQHEDRLRIQGLLVKWLAEKGWRHDIMIGE
ncbi:MAG: hypothetical protein ACOYWZ_11480 [Bacillota bacterium]